MGRNGFPTGEGGPWNTGKGGSTTTGKNIDGLRSVAGLPGLPGSSDASGGCGGGARPLMPLMERVCGVKGLLTGHIPAGSEGSRLHRFSATLDW